MGTINRKGMAKTRPTDARILADSESPFQAIRAYTIRSLNTLSFMAPPNWVALSHQKVLGRELSFMGKEWFSYQFTEGWLLALQGTCHSQPHFVNLFEGQGSY
jgi:hypothetical protein